MSLDEKAAHFTKQCVAHPGSLQLGATEIEPLTKWDPCEIIVEWRKLKQGENK